GSLRAQRLISTLLRSSGPRWKSSRDCGASQDRRWSKPAASGCPFPRAASLPRAEEWTGCPGSWRQRVKRSDSDSSPPSLVGLRRGGRSEERRVGKEGVGGGEQAECREEHT